MKWIIFFFPFLLFCVEPLERENQAKKEPSCLYDCIIVGSSPICLFEALYQKAIGNNVLILEGANSPGGAWQTVDVCGIEQIDLGCHSIRGSQELADFFHRYARCRIISLEGFKGFYFAGGCQELIGNLLHQLQTQSIELHLNHFVEKASIDETNKQVILHTQQKEFRTKKVIVPRHVRICEDNEAEKIRFYHLYLLIRDATPPKFSYAFGIPGVTRMVNQTPFKGYQLIILQVHTEQMLQKGEWILEQLKEKNLIDVNACLEASEGSIYAQWPHQPGCSSAYFERLETSSLSKVELYLDRWKKAL